MRNSSAGPNHVMFSAISILILVFTGTAVFAQQPVQIGPRTTPQRAQPSQGVPIGQSAPAQPVGAVPAAQINSPQRTTATYADWIVQCETQAGPPLVKACEMNQVTQLQNSNQPFSRTAIVRPLSKDQPIRLVVLVPVNVTFAMNVRIQFGDDPIVMMPFTRCVPNGCFAEIEAKEDAIKKFRSAIGAGKLAFGDGSGREIALPLSLNGFGQAYDALMRE